MLEIAAPGIGRIVDEDVQAAKALDGKADQLAADLLAGEIAFEVLRLLARRPDAAHRLEAVAGVAPVDDEIRPEPGEMLRNAAADSRGGSGHHRHFMGEGAHGISTDLMTRRSYMASNASRHPRAVRLFRADLPE